MQIISRKQALARGLKRYATGKQCRHGHVSERLVSSYACVECVSEKHAEWVKQNRDLLNAYQRQRYTNRNKDRVARRAEDRKLRAAAKASGATEYVSIIPCERGHIGPRYVSHGWCGICKREREAARRLNKPEAYRAASRKYLTKHIEKERKRWRLVAAKAYKADRNGILERNRRWRKQNPGKVLARNERRRARELGAEGPSLTAEEREAILAQAKRCHYCGKPFGVRRHPTIDHVRALTTGGRNDKTNIVAACRSCNSSKGDRNIDPTTGQGILL